MAVTSEKSRLSQQSCHFKRKKRYLVLKTAGFGYDPNISKIGGCLVEIDFFFIKPVGSSPGCSQEVALGEDGSVGI